MKKYVIGIDIGGTKCAVVLGKNYMAETEMEHVILDKICFPTHAVKGPEYTLRNILNAVREIMKRRGTYPEEISGIGISCGGPLNHETGVIMNPPNLYGWNNIHIVERFENEFGIPTFLQNDANACALAEWRFGAARGYKNVVFLTFGTGLGAGLILNGRLYNGTSDLAGEVGHVRLETDGPVGFGKAGSFEGFCSGGGIAQIARSRVLEKLQAGEAPAFCPDFESLDSLTAKDVAMAAEAGDGLAKEIYRISGHYLGVGLSILIDILNPEVIVLGSIYQRSRELLWPAAEEVIEKEALSASSGVCRIVPAELGDNIGDFAALSVALGQEPQPMIQAFTKQEEKTG